MKAMSAETGTAVTELNLEQIKAAAMAATPGPWAVDEGCLADSDRLYVAKGQPDKLLGRILEVFHNCLVRTVSQRKANAEFIAAANPAAVLALIERLERTEHERDSYKRALLSAPPMPAGILCKGSMALGSGCGLCERCRKEMEGAE